MNISVERRLNFPSIEGVTSRHICVEEYNLNKESDRLATFSDNNWQNAFLSPEELAIVGFYFYKHPDIVRCVFCWITLHDFQYGETALSEHIKHSPNCPLLKRRETRNEPIDWTRLDQILPPVSYDECGSRSTKSPSADENIKYPEYKLFQQRVKTYATWPIGIKQRPKELAEAGFFYNGQSDRTICFACGLELFQWSPDDNVWVEHKTHALTECSYLQLNEETVKLNEQKVQQLEKLEGKEEIINDVNDGGTENAIDFESLCKICLERKSNVIFLPCRHVAVCGQCAFGVDENCPICRTHIKEKIHLYYA